MIVASFQDIMFRDKKQLRNLLAAKDLGLSSDSSYNYDDHIKKIISSSCVSLTKTHTFFKTIPLYLPSYFTVPRCELPQIKIPVMKL